MEFFIEANDLAAPILSDLAPPEGKKSFDGNGGAPAAECNFKQGCV